MKQTIFYSWQSDIHFNNQAIRDALRAVTTELENIDGNPQFNLIDSSSNLVGATHIPENILRDIGTSDVFVCDLTIVGRGIHSERNIANPNVLIELGYALSQLSWQRTIVIFNEHFGDLKKDLPFDIEKRSVLTTLIRNKEDGNGKGHMRTKLRDWIQKIIRENPKKPAQFIQSYDLEKRKADIKVIRRIKSLFIIELMDEFFSEGYIKIDRMVVESLVDYLYFTSSISFYVNDSGLSSLIIDLREQVRNLDELLDQYKMGTTWYTHLNKDGSDPSRFDAAKNFVHNMGQTFFSLIQYIRKNYPEVKFNMKEMI